MKRAQDFFSVFLRWYDGWSTNAKGAALTVNISSDPENDEEDEPSCSEGETAVNNLCSIGNYCAVQSAIAWTPGRRKSVTSSTFFLT